MAQVSLHTVRTSIKLVNLESHFSLFKNQEAFDKFTLALLEVINTSEVTILTCGDTAIASLTSVMVTKEGLQHRIMSRLAKESTFLNKEGE